jgi:hypothetical protein
VSEENSQQAAPRRRVLKKNASSPGASNAQQTELLPGPRGLHQDALALLGAELEASADREHTEDEPDETPSSSPDDMKALIEQLSRLRSSVGAQRLQGEAMLWIVRELADSVKTLHVEGPKAIAKALDTTLDRLVQMRAEMERDWRVALVTPTKTQPWWRRTAVITTAVAAFVIADVSLMCWLVRFLE